MTERTRMTKEKENEGTVIIGRSIIAFVSLTHCATVSD